MNIRAYVVLALLCFSITAKGQGQSTHFDMGFIRHLMNKNMHEEAIYLLQEERLKTNPSSSFFDTINFSLGKAYYETKQLAYSADYFLQVSAQSPYYAGARLFSGYNYFFLDNIDLGLEVLHNLEPFEKPLYNELVIFQKTGGALLKHDFDAFENYSEKFTHSFYQLQDEENQLVELKNSLTSFNQKSMALAGIMSAIVPGSGKIYAGKVGEGLSALLTTAVLGAMTTENYLKDGIKSPKTIIFGGLFSVFYLGNIYGSMVSVKVYREEYYDTIENKILFHLHIPLRTVFN